MKKLAAIELACIIKELQYLENSKVDKIYQNKKEVIIQLHKAGKILLKIIFGSSVFITNKKEEIEPTQFCLLLRKHLSQSRLESIKQKDFERIIELKFKGKEEHILIIELFGKGNIILCDNDYNIISLLEKQIWKDRKITFNEKYVFPKSPTPNLFNLTEKELSNIIKKSKKENIVKILAIDFGLGGTYAEEICLKSDIDKNAKSVDSKILFEQIEELRKLNIKPIISDNEAFPFDLETKKNKEYVKTFNEALEKTFIPEIKEDKRVKSLKEIADKQKKQIDKLQKDAIKYKMIGDKIYQNFNTIEEILKGINNNKWKYDHPLIKEKSPKDKKIIIEI